MTIDVLKLKEFIEILPLFLNYIGPGYIFYKISEFQLGRSGNKENNYLFNYLIFSYFLNVLLSIFLNQEDRLYSFILLTISVVLSVIYVNVIEKNWFIEFLSKFNFYKGIKTDIISEIVDSKLGVWIKIYIKSEEVIYIGKLIRYDNEMENMHRYMVLSEYCCYSYDGDVLEDNYGEYTKCVLLNIANVNRLELLYDEDSEKIIKLKKFMEKNS